MKRPTWRSWERLAAYHDRAAELCRAIADAKLNRGAWHGLRLRLTYLERRGGRHRADLYDAEWKLTELTRHARGGSSR